MDTTAEAHFRHRDETDANTDLILLCLYNGLPMILCFYVCHHPYAKLSSSNNRRKFGFFALSDPPSIVTMQSSQTNKYILPKEVYKAGTGTAPPLPAAWTTLAGRLLPIAFSKALSKSFQMSSTSSTPQLNLTRLSLMLYSFRFSGPCTVMIHFAKVTVRGSCVLLAVHSIGFHYSEAQFCNAWLLHVASQRASFGS